MYVRFAKYATDRIRKVELAFCFLMRLRACNFQEVDGLQMLPSEGLKGVRIREDWFDWNRSGDMTVKMLSACPH